MELDELYNILNLSEGSKTFKIGLNSNSPIYAAHFPGNPITPGVCLIHMACHLVQDFFLQRLVLMQVVNAKFLAPLSPISNPEVFFRIKQADWTEEDHTRYLKVITEVFAGNTIFTKLSLLFRVPGSPASDNDYYYRPY